MRRDPPRALIFDVFGTLGDWRSSVARQVAEVLPDADAEAFADAWRAQYDPSMAPVRDGRRAYVALDVLHRESLDVVLRDLGPEDRLDGPARDALATAWERLDPWPEVPAALARLRERFFVAPCSNGSVALMVRLARHAGLRWDTVLGADTGRNYKPHPDVYLASCRALGLDPREVMMVAAHNSDLAAARDCGLQTGFFARATEHGPGQTRDLGPDAAWDVVDVDLAGLADALGA